MAFQLVLQKLFRTESVGNEGSCLRREMEKVFWTKFCVLFRLAFALQRQAALHSSLLLDDSLKRPSRVSPSTLQFLLGLPCVGSQAY